MAANERVAGNEPVGSVRQERMGSKGNGSDVLITGGAGFIGRNLVIAFLRAGFRVASVDVAATDEDARRTLAAEEQELCRAYRNQLRFEIADITDEVGLDRVFARNRPSLVIHAAALTALSDDDERQRFVSSWDVNVAGTAKVLEASRRAGANRFVLVSSGTVYGSGPTAIALREDAELRPNSTYGISKYMAEMLCRRHQALWTGQPEVRIVRISSPYGDWEQVRNSRPGTSEICTWAYQAIQGKPLKGFPDGARDFTYVGDAVDGILRVALAAETRHDTYNVAAGRLVPFSEVMHEIINLKPAVAEYEAPAHNGPTEDQPRLARGPLSVDRMRDEFGFEAATGLSQGLRQYFDWIGHQGSALPGEPVLRQPRQETLLPIRAVLIDATDDVASVLGDAREGDTLVIECYGGTPPHGSIIAAESIPFGHKVAMRDMPSGTVVRKYSHPIGQLIVDTRLGQHVHTQNLRGIVAAR